jgi:hypothetical protein
VTVWALAALLVASLVLVALAAYAFGAAGGPPFQARHRRK